MIQKTNNVVFLEHHRHKKMQRVLQTRRLLSILEAIENLPMDDDKKEVVKHGLKQIRKD